MTLRKSLRAFWAVLLILLAAEIADLAYLYQARATVSGTTTRIVALGDNSNTVFTFPFIGVKAADITVTYTDTAGAQTVLSSSLYTLALSAPATGQIWGIGGTVTYPLSGSPIATGTTLTIQRLMPLTQTVSSNQGQSFPIAVETALDLLAMQIQQVNSVYQRAIVASATDTCTSLGNLPTASSRASQMLGFDSTGCNPIVAQPSSALVSSAMQPVVAAASIGAATTLLGINTNFNVPVGAELDWPGLTAPPYWKIEDSSAISRITYSALFAVLAPVVSCTIASGSATITGISSTVGWGTGWIIESPGSSALAAGQTIATVGGSSITITGGNASTNATSCRIFPYGTAQDGTFNLPGSRGSVYAGLDTSHINLNSTYCTGNPAYLNAFCGAQSVSTTIAQDNLPNIVPTFTGTALAGHTHTVAVTNNNSAGGSSTNAMQAGGAGISTGSTSAGTPAGTISSINGNVTQTAIVKSTLQPTRIRNKIIFTGAP